MKVWQEFKRMRRKYFRSSFFSEYQSPPAWKEKTKCMAGMVDSIRLKHAEAASSCVTWWVGVSDISEKDYWMPINWHYSNYRQNCRYRQIENLKLSKNYRYWKMYQIWSDKFMESWTHISQENVRMNTLSCLLTMRMLCLFDPFCIFLTIFCTFSCAFLWQNLNFANYLRKLSKILSKADISAFFKLSANYRYRN